MAAVNIKLVVTVVVTMADSHSAVQMQVSLSSGYFLAKQVCTVGQHTRQACVSKQHDVPVILVKSLFLLEKPHNCLVHVLGLPGDSAQVMLPGCIVQILWRVWVLISIPHANIYTTQLLTVSLLSSYSLQICFTVWQSS